MVIDAPRIIRQEETKYGVVCFQENADGSEFQIKFDVRNESGDIPEKVIELITSQEGPLNARFYWNDVDSAWAMPTRHPLRDPRLMATMTKVRTVFKDVVAMLSGEISNTLYR